jgi:S1-C subfamily serine protease
LLLALAVAIGCGGSDDEGEDAGAQTDAADAAVAITNTTGGRKIMGSGVIFDRRGWVLTSAQTIWDVGSLDVQLKDGSHVHGELEARSPCDDIAIVTLHGAPQNLPVARIAKAKSVRSGAQVTAVGYPVNLRGRKRSTPSTTNGKVSAAYVVGELQPVLPTFPSLIQHQAPVTKGMVGGPLTNANGEVVGVNTQIERGGSADEGINYAISNKRVRAMLGELTTDRKGHAFGGWGKYHACHNTFSRVIHRQRGFVPAKYRGGGQHQHDESEMEEDHGDHMH